MSERELLHATADYAADFIDTLADRPIPAEAGVDRLYATLGGPCRSRESARGPRSQHSPRPPSPASSASRPAATSAS